MSKSEMNGHGHDFGHEFLSESVSEADSDTDTTFYGSSGTDVDRVMISDTDTILDKSMSENLGHGFRHGQTSDTCVRSSLLGVISDVRLERRLRFTLGSGSSLNWWKSGQFLTKILSFPRC